MDQSVVCMFLKTQFLYDSRQAIHWNIVWLVQIMENLETIISFLIPHTLKKLHQDPSFQPFQP